MPKIIFRVIWVGLLCSAFFARAGVPDWAEPWLAKDVTGLGKGYAWMRLGETHRVQYSADRHVRRTYRGAVRILTEEGRRFAAVVKDYNADTERIAGAKAWLVSADGRKTESFGVTDFIDEAVQEDGIFWPQDRELSFSTRKSVEVNGVLVWQIEIESQVGMNDFTFSFPDDVPTAVFALDIAPSPGGRLEWRASGGVSAPVAGAGGALHWEEQAHRPPHSGDRPANFIPADRLVAVRAIGADGVDEEKTWGDIARLADGIVAPRIASGSPGLQAKAVALATGKKTRWERIRAISEFVQKEVTYLNVTLDRDCFAGYRPHPAAEILKNRYGDCKDKATLLVAMLRAIGEDARPVLVFYGNPAAVLPNWPSPSFNHMITCVPAGDDMPANWPTVNGGAIGRVVLFDPTSEATPLGVLPRGDQGGHGLIIDARSTELIDLPAVADSLDCQVEAQVDARGEITAKVTETTTGTIAADQHSIRETTGEKGFTDAMEGLLHRTVPFLEGLHWTDTWNPAIGELKLDFDFHARRYGRTTGDLMLINPQVVFALRQLSPLKTGRPGVVWSTGGKYHQVVKIALPPQTSVLELPEAWQGKGPGVAGGVSYRQEAGDVILECDVTHTPTYLDRENYAAARQFMQNLIAAGRRPIVLKMPAAH